jgi:hypothetical protein
MPRSGPGLPERGWGPRGLGFESVPGGVPTGTHITSGGRGRPRGGGARAGQKGASKGWHGPSGCGGHCRALALRPIAALSPITVRRLNV